MGATGFASAHVFDTLEWSLVWSSNMTYRKRVKHYHEPGHLHELTFSCYQRKSMLTNDSWLEILATTLDAAAKAEVFDLVAFVFMPEHVHLLVFPRSPQPSFGSFLAQVKQPFSRMIKEVLTTSGSQLLEKLMIQERPGKTCFRFWQAGGGYDRNIFTLDAITASIDYIHNNPVQRRLCENATDWKWSSARYYLLEPPRQQFRGLPHIHGLPRGSVS